MASSGKNFAPTFCIDLATVNVYTKNAKGIIHYRFSIVYIVNQYNHIVIV